MTPKLGRLRYEEMVEDVINDYFVNNKRSIAHAKRRFKLHLDPFFGNRLEASITTADVRRYVAERKAAGTANAGINRELAHPQAGLLALDAGRQDPGETLHTDAQREQRPDRFL